MVAPESKLLRVPVDGLLAGEAKLDEQATHYLVHVHRAAVGDKFMAFDVEAATEGVATLQRADSRYAKYSVSEIHGSSRLPRHRLVLIQAFGKGSKIDQVVRDATVLDVTELRIVSTARSGITGPHETRGRLQRWRKIAVEAARQCERGNVPNIEGVLGFGDALSAVQAYQKWILSPWASDALGGRLAVAPLADAALLIGPEGGFDDNESALARAAGFDEVRLGPRVLRSETAATAALGAIAALRERGQAP